MLASEVLCAQAANVFRGALFSYPLSKNYNACIFFVGPAACTATHFFFAQTTSPNPQGEPSRRLTSSKGISRNSLMHKIWLKIESCTYCLLGSAGLIPCGISIVFSRVYQDSRNFARFGKIPNG